MNVSMFIFDFTTHLCIACMHTYHTSILHLHAGVRISEAGSSVSTHTLLTSLPSCMHAKYSHLPSRTHMPIQTCT